MWRVRVRMFRCVMTAPHCHVKPCETNACAGEGVVPARQHQRLPLLRLCILRLRLYVRLHPVQCPVPNLRAVAHGPRYLGPLVPVANLPGRRKLRSGGTSRLIVPSVRRSTVGDQAFSVAGPRVWNTLPEEITTSQSLPTFRHQLKTWLFRKSYPDIIMC